MKPRVPRGTELDLWRGRALVSLVGFMFLNTRVRGIPIPFHMNFEELNLRFYIKRPHPEGERRAVAFVKEIVPRRAVSFIARAFYNENYATHPMRHSFRNLNGEPGAASAHYEWNLNGRWNRLGVSCAGGADGARIPEKNSEAEFITEHYWGYAVQRNGAVKEYRVAHPQWRTSDAQRLDFDADAETLYGPAFGAALKRAPCSALLADGSPVTVSSGVLL